jgi:hypothetical protein
MIEFNLEAKREQEERQKAMDDLYNMRYADSLKVHIDSFAVFQQALKAQQKFQVMDDLFNTTYYDDNSTN